MATSRPQTPAHDSYGAGAYGDTSLSATPGNPIETSPLSQSVQQPTRDPRFQEDFDTSRRGSSILDAGLGGTGGMLRRADSTASISGQQLQPAIPPSRGGTLKKKAALSRNASLKRSNSRRSSHAGSVRSLALGEREKYDGTDELNNAFFTPVPTQGNPTEILIDRFQAWRKVLKDLVAYFREIQNSYEQRSKSVLKVSNIMGNMHLPSLFLSEGGIGDANNILRSYHKQAITDSNKAKELENNVILQLTGLRSDLQQKIKEIKSLSGDFKNSVDKEMEVTKKAVHGLQEALGVINTDPSAIAGKGDPFIVKLAVERQIERQIDEENYLHRAHLNLESSGRELESIVVGEIQKAYNVYAGLLKKDADEAYDTVEKLRSGPVALPKDHEWQAFVTNDNHFINPQLPLRHAEDIYYPGRDDAAAAEVRSGMLERKSKYLKSYTAGWYVLSPTHLHEFKSADRINAQPPVMSLLLPDQKLGSHAQPGSSSHKFILKGRQTGSMHRGHSWVFRAESHDTMLAWYEDIKALTEKSGAERDTYVRKHARSISQTSQKAGSISSDGGMDEDEADSIPYSGAGGIVPPTNQYNNNIQQNTTALAMQQQKPKRPSPGGRFPSDIQLETLRDGGLLANATISDSGSDPDRDRDVIAAAAGMPGTSGPLALGGDEGRSSHPFDAEGSASSSQLRYRHGESALAAASTDGGEYEGIYTPVADRDYAQQNALPSPPEIERHDSKYGDWMSPRAPPASTGNGGAATTTTAAATAAAYEHQARKAGTEQEQVPVIDTAAKTAAARQRGHTQSSTSSRPFEMMGGAASSQVGSVSTIPSTVAEGVVGQEDGELGGSGGVGKLDGELGGKGGAAAFAPTSSEASTALSGEGDRRADSMLSTESSRLSHLHVPGEFPPTPPGR